jgi:predicted amino acid dehydrogenase
MRIFRRRPQPVPDWAVEIYGHIYRKLDRMERAIMTTLQELQDKADATLASVTAETDLNNAIAKVVNDQRQQIIDLKAQLDAAGQDPTKLQALSDTMDQIITLHTSNEKIVSDAVLANTGAEPTT